VPEAVAEVPAVTGATRILRLLGEEGAPLRGDGSVRLGTGEAAVTVTDGEIAAMAAEGLVERRAGRIVRTAEGRAYLRRALAPAADRFAAQHRELRQETLETRGEAVHVVVNAAESPLAWLAGRRDRTGAPLISPEQYEAGRRLASDHARGHGTARLTQSWDASGVRGEAPRDRLAASEVALDARRRVERALSAVGPGLAEVLLAVCCEEVGLEAVERRQGWPARSAKVVLRLALDRLAAHYGLAAEALGAEGHAMVHWGAEGYRPSA